MKMNLENDVDLKRIYGDSLNQQMINNLRVHLKTFLSDAEDILDSEPIRLKNYKRMYFSVFHRLRSNSPVLFAGGMDENRNDDNKLFPVIRVDGHNIALRLVSGFTFDYSEEDQKTNKVCIKLREETINVVPFILWSQLQWFTDEFSKD